jgi:hypothetical protein
MLAQCHISQKGQNFNCKNQKVASNCKCVGTYGLFFFSDVVNRVVVVEFEDSPWG